MRTALNRHLLPLTADIEPESSDFIAKELKLMLDKGDLNGSIDCLKMLFSRVPYQIHVEAEYFYHGLLQMAFYASGIKAQSEYSTSHARIDLVLDLPSLFYVIEIKFNESAEEALAQIEERKYYEPFLKCGKPITLLGLSFKKEPCSFEITYVKKDLENKTSSL